MDVSQPNPFAPPRADLDVEAVPAAPGALPPASRGSRFVATILDTVMFLPIGLFPGILSLVLRDARPTGQGNPISLAVAWAVGGLYFIVVSAIQIYFLTTRGQSLGKRWMHIRIVRTDGTPPGFMGAFFLRSFVNQLVGSVPFYTLIDSLFIFREDRRCIHDLLAGTIVVTALETSPEGRTSLR